MRQPQLLFITFLCIIGFNACHKTVDDTTITLKNKPLRVIQEKIKGKWKLEYSKGGICGSCTYPSSSNLVMDLTSGNFIKLYHENQLIVDTIITWKKVIDISNSETYQLFYYDRRGYPYNYGVEGIYKDTLVFYENAVDGQHHYYSPVEQ